MKHTFNQRYISLIIILGIVVFSIFGLLYNADTNESENIPTQSIKIGNTTFKVDVLDTYTERVKGLSDRLTLPKGEGVLFVFDELNRHGIWMKDMNFPIDIIWINDNLKVIDIKNDAEPASFPEVFYPQDSAWYVIEVNGGFVKKHDIKIGDRVFLKTF